jgi:putative ABC transport system permease protein
MRALFQMAFRNVFRQKRRSVLLGLSIGLGAMVLLLGLAFVESFQKQLFENLLVQQAGNFVIHQREHKVDISPLAKPSADFSTALTDDVLERDVAAIPGIRQVRKQLVFTGALVHADGTTQVNVIGLSGLKGESLAELTGASGGTGVTEGIFLPEGMSDEIGQKPGSELALFARKADGQTTKVPLTVQGLFAAKAPWLTNRVYIPLAQAQQILGLSGKSMEWLLYVDASANASQLKADLDGLMRKHPDVQVSSVAEVGGFYAGAMLGFKALMVVNMVFLFFVVAMGMTNMMLMATLERTPEIGTLLAIGTPRWRVASLIVLEALLLAFMAVCAGTGLAYGSSIWFAANGIDLRQEALKYIVGGTKVYLIFTGVNFSITLAVVLCTIFLAALYPAVKAASWSPIRALRGQH